MFPTLPSILADSKLMILNLTHSKLRLDMKYLLAFSNKVNCMFFLFYLYLEMSKTCI